VSMMSVAGEAWPSQLDGRTTLPRPRDLAGELCTPRPPRSHAGNTGTCGQRATGPGLGLPPVIEHVDDLLKRPSSARTHGTRVRRSRRATSWDRYTLPAPANRRRPCHEGVGGPHPQREHGREAPAGELPLAVGVPRSSAFSPPFRSTRHAGGQALQRCSKKTDPLVGMMIGAG